MNMKKFISIWFFFLIVFSILSCSDTNNFAGPPATGDKVVLDSEVNDFVWRSLNSWYNWQTDSNNLADTKADDLDEYYTFLNQYTDPSDLMYDLCYKHWRIVGSENAVDRFSWFIEDFDVHEEGAQGIRTVFGFRYQSVQINDSGDIIFYMRHVEPGSPADIAGIKRGDIVNKLNGTQLTAANYDTTINALFEESVTLSFISAADGKLTQLEDKSITRTKVVSNPVHFKKVFDNIDGKKVGYLVYNQFSASFNDELNDAFAFFKSEGINELVLDLRLNGGGSVDSAAFLASMISAATGSGVFTELNFNAKHQDQNGAWNFTDKLTVYDVNWNAIGSENINRLVGIDKLYVLVSGSTASASEMVINGLRPYLSQVILIGTTTYGKNVGSITLYDNPSSDYSSKPRSPTHKMAMQPIVFAAYNKNGESDFIQGFLPDIEVKEWNYWDNILPFGDENEIVLKAALDDIRGITAKTSLSKRQQKARFIDSEKSDYKFDKEMYIDPGYFNQN